MEVSLNDFDYYIYNLYLFIMLQEFLILFFEEMLCYSNWYVDF